MKNKIFIIVILILALGGCKRHNSDKEREKSYSYIDTIATQAVKKTKVVSTEDYSKIIVIDTPSLAFFMPEYKERRNILQFYGDDAYSKMQLQLMFRNFYRLYRAVCPEVKKNNINCFFTYHWKFKIKTDTGYIYFDRKEQNQLFGFILADGQRAPQFYFGLYRIGQMEELIRNYFGIPDFKINQSFILDQAPPVEGSP